jgi:hypothetical protein
VKTPGTNTLDDRWLYAGPGIQNLFQEEDQEEDLGNDRLTLGRGPGCRLQCKAPAQDLEGIVELDTKSGQYFLICPKEGGEIGEILKTRKQVKERKPSGKIELGKRSVVYAAGKTKLELEIIDN